MSTLQEKVCTHVRNMKQSGFGVLLGRARQIKEELKQVKTKCTVTFQYLNTTVKRPMGFDMWDVTCPQGERKPYTEVIDVSSGDLHSAGLKPLSFVRQVI